MIENSIRTQALKTTTLTNLIGHNFHLNTKHSSLDNYVVLHVINDPVEIELHLEESQRDAVIQIDCFSKNPITAQLIAKQIKLIFNKKGFSDSEITVQLAILQNRTPDHEEDTGLHRESLDFIFKYNPKEA